MRMTEDEILALSPLRMNFIIEEEIFGINLEYTDKEKLYKLAKKYTVSAGSIFRLKTGDDFKINPEDSSDVRLSWTQDINAKFFVQVGKFLVDKYPNLKEEVNDFKKLPRDFYNSIHHALILANKMMLTINMKYDSKCEVFYANGGGYQGNTKFISTSGKITDATLAELPRAICIHSIMERFCR